MIQIYFLRTSQIYTQVKKINYQRNIFTKKPSSTKGFGNTSLEVKVMLCKESATLFLDFLMLQRLEFACLCLYLLFKFMKIVRSMNKKNIPRLHSCQLLRQYMVITAYVMKLKISPWWRMSFITHSSDLCGLYPCLGSYSLALKVFI